LLLVEVPAGLDHRVHLGVLVEVPADYCLEM
jgi:hypothetical protein